MTCPNCWEKITIVLDLSVTEQDYIEDCSVCCRPMRIRYTTAAGALVSLDADSAGE